MVLPGLADGRLPEVVRWDASPRVVPSPVTRFFEGERVSQTLYGVAKTLFDST